MRARHCSTKSRLRPPAARLFAVAAMLRMGRVLPVGGYAECNEIAALPPLGRLLTSNPSIQFPGARVSQALALSLHDSSGTRRGEIAIGQAVVAGWTGRDAAAVEKHIKELEALGVKRPATTPIFYRVSAARLTTDETIEAV